jgi:hypothetical protein
VKKTDYNFKKIDRFGFGFISLKPNQTQTEKNQVKLEKNRVKSKKLSQTGKTKPNYKNQFEPVFILK